ncbi:MAG: TrmH family RNA methyltransferase [Thermoproteota archaeon]
MELFVVFFHPKDPRNVADVASLVKFLRGSLYVVRRPGSPSPIVERLMMSGGTSVKEYETIEEVLKEVSQATIHVILETYGEMDLRDLCKRLLDSGMHGGVAVYIGAEDYGIPPQTVSKVRERFGSRAYTVRIPVAVAGMSYNVVVSLSIALYEILTCIKGWSRHNHLR